jgi:hypothetical protein
VHQQKSFDGTMYNMMGSPYAMMEADAMTFGKPYRVSSFILSVWLPVALQCLAIS